MATAMPGTSNSLRTLSTYAVKSCNCVGRLGCALVEAGAGVAGCAVCAHAGAVITSKAKQPTRRGERVRRNIRRLHNGKAHHYGGKGIPDPALKVMLAATSTRGAAIRIMGRCIEETHERLGRMDRRAWPARLGGAAHGWR